MTESLISIALCTYNGEKYLSQQLDSILNQTYRNLEIIIVDDCSKDTTWDIVKKYAQADSRIKYYRNDVNLGYNKNFERAISLTTGDFISISDQDDIWTPDKIEILKDNIQDNWLVFSNSEFMEEDGTAAHTLLDDFRMEGKSYKSILFTNYVAGHAVLFKKEFLNYLLPFPEVGFYDWWMAFVAFYHHKATYVNKVLTRYRKHSASVMQNILKNEKEKVRYLLFKINIDEFTAFETYRDLKKEDKVYISNMKKAFLLRLKYPYSVPLIRIIEKDYNILFSELKSRKGFSRLNFAMKQSVKVKNDE